MKGSFGGRPEPFIVQRHPKLRRLFTENGLENVASEACGKPTTRRAFKYDANRFDSQVVEGLPEEPMYATPGSPFVSAGGAHEWGTTPDSALLRSIERRLETSPPPVLCFGLGREVGAAQASRSALRTAFTKSAAVVETARKRAQAKPGAEREVDWLIRGDEEAAGDAHAAEEGWSDVVAPSQVEAGDPAQMELEDCLPPDACTALRHAGMTHELYPWQAECLATPGVLQGRNLVYGAPTSGGKSLVAEVVMLRRLMETWKPALLVLPFVSLCSEKAVHLSKVLKFCSREVLELYGARPVPSPLPSQAGIIVCTIEKANILINKLLEQNALSALSCVVVDELHLVGDEDRGYQLELLLTKLRFLARQAAVHASKRELEGGEQSAATSPSTSPSLSNPQIVGMSATLPNLEQVGVWLDAAVYASRLRPVPLHQYLAVNTALEDPSGDPVRQLAPPPGWPRADRDLSAWLATETVRAGRNVLVFCGSKRACETFATSLGRFWAEAEGRMENGSAEEDVRKRWAAIAAQLEALPDHSRALATAVRSGTAFHHAGLLAEEREIVERAYRAEHLRALAATSTLAAGVNLPVHRVVVKHAYQGICRPDTTIDATLYRQMAGRSGRSRSDAFGEVILVANNSVPLARLRELAQAEPAPVASCLGARSRGMRRAMLEVVAAGAVRSARDVQLYCGSTLLAATVAGDVVRDSTIEALKWLGRQGFVIWDAEAAQYRPTVFGKAAFACGLLPELCLSLLKDLSAAREGFVLSTDLHLTFLCVPLTEELLPNWLVFWKRLPELSDAEQAVVKSVGLSLAHVGSRARGVLPQLGEKATALEEPDRVAKRFWASLILSDLIAEVDLATVCARYGAPRAAVQGLQERSARFASMVAAFCERMGWVELEVLVSQYQSRVLHGVRADVLVLTTIPFVKAATARRLHQAGLKTVEAVAAVSDLDILVRILSANRRQPPDKGLILHQATRILQGARRCLARRAQELLEEAQRAKAVLGAEETLAEWE